MTIAADINLTAKDISNLATADAIAALLNRLGYPTARREELPAATFGLPPDTADAICGMELLAEDEEQFFRVILVQLRSVTAKTRNELARNLGKRGADHRTDHPGSPTPRRVRDSRRRARPYAPRS